MLELLIKLQLSSADSISSGLCILIDDRKLEISIDKNRELSFKFGYRNGCLGACSDAVIGSWALTGYRAAKHEARTLPPPLSSFLLLESPVVDAIINRRRDLFSLDIIFTDAHKFLSIGLDEPFKIKGTQYCAS